MRHTDFKDKNSSFNIIETCSDDTKVFKFTLADGLSELDTIEATEIGDFYSFSIDTPDEDCFLFTKQGLNIGIFRVGKPDVLVIVCSNEDETISYKQLDMDGAKLDEGDMEEIGEGFYYIEPSTLNKSFFTIEDMIIPLVVPYRKDGQDGESVVDEVEITTSSNSTASSNDVVYKIVPVCKFEVNLIEEIPTATSYDHFKANLIEEVPNANFVEDKLNGEMQL